MCTSCMLFLCVPASGCFCVRTSSLLSWYVYQLPVVCVCVPSPCCFYVYQLPVAFVYVPAPCCASLILHFVLDFLFLNAAPPPPPSPSHFVSPWEFLQYCGTLKQGGRWFIRKVWPLGWCCTTVCLQGGSDHRAKGQRRRTARCEVIQ